MATVARDLTSIALLIAEIPNYNGWKIYKIPAQHAGNNIDTPARFIVWLRHKYQTETVGAQQVATQRLAQEKFLPFDNPETYKTRICPLLLGVADGNTNILGLLKGHLSGELYTWMKIANPAGINAFFTELKNMWLERPPNLYRSSISDQIFQAPPITSQSTITSKEMTKPKTETQVQSQQPISRPISLQIRPQPAGASEKILEENMNRLLLWLYGEAPEFIPIQAPSLPPKPQLKKNITSNTDNSDEITKDMADMSLNMIKWLKALMLLLKPLKNLSGIAQIVLCESSSSESESEAEININISQAKKKRRNQRLEIKDAEALPLASVPISKKEKQSLKFPSQDEQAHLEKIIEKIIEKPETENSKTSADSEDDKFIDNPMEIDFVQRKEPATDVVTTKSKRLKLEIDTKEKHDHRGIATTPTKSLGIVRNISVNFAPRCTIYADFTVVKYPKPMLILPNILLDKYNYNLLALKRELRLEYNGKEFFIPVNMHKVKNNLEVNCANITPDCNDFSTLDNISQDS
ncbi:hypothetical protein C2G38_2179929 [Gigaspora rosea]|uniref:Uncharacterized protein n=1 Tax=Gigaspora rosea TaxID=44941 RepID=A0A397VJX0_9GLOM|nr:hypothetical protein C2G38_2179929 [Gigaspora rosea]